VCSLFRLLDFKKRKISGISEIYERKLININVNNKELNHLG
jgi:hypothetical protein